MSAGDAPGGNKSISTQLMQNPELLAALQVSHYYRMLCTRVQNEIISLNLMV